MLGYSVGRRDRSTRNGDLRSEEVTWVALALEDVRPVREYPKNVELRRFVMSWRPIDWYRLAPHPVRGKLQLCTIDTPERERPPVLA